MFKYLVSLQLLVSTSKGNISKDFSILPKVFEGVPCAGVKIVAR